MAEEQNQDGAESQADDAAEGQAAHAATESQSGDGEDGTSVDELKKLRAENAKWRKQLRETESKLSEREKAELSEREKLERDRDSAQQKLAALESEVGSLRVQVLAPRAGIRPDAVRAASALLDWSQVDDPSDERQVIRALKEVAKENAYMTVAGGADGGAGGGEQGQVTDMTALIRRAAGRSA